MIVLLIFTATVTPFEVAFLEPSWDALFFINRVVDAMFLVDLIINFFTPYYNINEGGFVIERWKMAKHYLTGWFTIDLVSILPFDTVGLVLNNDDINQLKVFRIIRLARLAKLLRVLRSSRIFKRWESRIGMQYSTMTMIKWTVFVLMLCHWLACLWHLVIAVEAAEELGQPLNWVEGYALGVSNPGELYLTSLYWSTMTCTTIGYGDVTPKSNGERFVALIGMCIGSAAYAYIVGNICGIIATMDQATTEFNATMDDLNLYMAENHMPAELRVRLREYFMYCRQINRQKYYSTLLEKMSPALRGEVTYFINKAWIEAVPFLSRNGPMGAAIGEEEHRLFITDVAMSLNAVAFGPQEVIVKLGEPAERMYIMQRGVVAKQGQIIAGGKYFGEDIIMAAARRTYMVRALTFVDLFVLEKSKLEGILQSANFENIELLIRRAALCESFKMSFIRLAHMRAGIKDSKYLAVPQAGSRPSSAKRLRTPASAQASQQGNATVVERAENELQISRKISEDRGEVIQYTTPEPASPSRRKSSTGRRRSNQDSGGAYVRSKPPRILEMLQNRHDELVNAIKGLAQRSDRRADMLEQRLTKISSTWTMGLSLMVLLLAGMVVGLLVGR